MEEIFGTDVNDCYSLCNLIGYKLILKPRSWSAHGGVTFYLQDNLDYHILDIIDIRQSWDVLFIEVCTGNQGPNGIDEKLVVGNIYRPPRANLDNIVSFTDD